jgi:hypothetical protein
VLNAEAVMKDGLRQQAQADWFVFSDARAETAFLLHLSKQTHWTSARLRFIVGAMWLTAIGRFTYAFLWEHHPRSYGWASSRDNTKYRRCSRQHCAACIEALVAAQCTPRACTVHFHRCTLPPDGRRSGAAWSSSPREMRCLHWPGPRLPAVFWSLACPVQTGLSHLARTS